MQYNERSVRSGRDADPTRTYESRDVQIEIRVKNARLLDAIEARWGKIIDAQWAKRNKQGARPVVKMAAALAGVHQSAMSALLRLALPAYGRWGKPSSTVSTIVDALDVPVAELFPPEICAERVKPAIRYLDCEQFQQLSAVPDRAAIAPAPDDPGVQADYYPKAIERLMVNLRPSEREVIERRFGLNGNEPQTRNEIAGARGVSITAIAATERRALGRLRREASHIGALDWLDVPGCSENAVSERGR